MIIYIDLLLVLNFIYDLLILNVVSIVLKRNTNNKRLILSSIIGELSILLIKCNYITLLISKVLLAIALNIVSFDYKNIKYTLINLSYFYMISIILGGFIYYCYLNNINYLITMLIIPILLTIYIIQNNLKYNYSNYYNTVITLNNNHIIKRTGYLDTGNNLIDPINNNLIIVLNKDVINPKKYYLVPIQVLNETLLLKCIKIKNIKINNKIFNNITLAISDTYINIDGVDILLNNNLRKELLNE